MPKRMVAQLTLGVADATIVVDGMDYTPDVMHDMLARAKEGLWEVLSYAQQMNVDAEDGVTEPELEMSQEDLEDLMRGITDGE